MKLKGLNLFHSNIVADNVWADVSEQSDPMWRNLQTSDDIDESSIEYEADSDEEIEGNFVKQNE